MQDVCEQFECELVEFNSEVDHVHLLVNFPPTVALSKLVNSFKGASSRYLRRYFPEVRRYFWRGARRVPACGPAPISPARPAAPR